MDPEHPVRLSIDHPGRTLNRLTSAPDRWSCRRC
jgi:hypothetical protein